MCVLAVFIAIMCFQAMQSLLTLANYFNLDVSSWEILEQKTLALTLIGAIACGIIWGNCLVIRSQSDIGVILREKAKKARVSRLNRERILGRKQDKAQRGVDHPLD